MLLYLVTLTILLVSLLPSDENLVSFLSIGKDCITLEAVLSNLYIIKLHLNAHESVEDESSSRLIVFKKDKKVKKLRKMNVDFTSLLGLL
ncbi:hypothetical protein VIGAN_02268300 [Vigna angularis var. angularis]|uniref:Uncharacterized protein n=1 Tax=Vigna angularis var. angularis TaxID=157739 RepID=A0A0S3RGR4_PHAAN|nr:hypothetical protein VIGAN_02268300 [Vigna angularis var. angularis]